MTSTITPVIPTPSGGRASQPCRTSTTACRTGLTRTGAIHPISTIPTPTNLAWLPIQPTVATWTDAR